MPALPPRPTTIHAASETRRLAHRLPCHLLYRNVARVSARSSPPASGAGVSPTTVQTLLAVGTYPLGSLAGRLEFIPGPGAYGASPGGSAATLVLPAAPVPFSVNL